MKEQKISIKALNELMNPQTKSKFYKSDGKGHEGIQEGYYDGVQGEYNEIFKFYQHPELPENIFMKETHRTDSYGDNDYLHSVEFVEGKAKTITVYEPIK